LFLTRNGTHPLRSNFARDPLKLALAHGGLGDRNMTWLSLLYSRLGRGTGRSDRAGAHQPRRRGGIVVLMIPADSATA
jgi:hypothetical protein